MTRATRMKVFAGAVLAFNLVIIFWFVINVLGGRPFWMGLLNLLWHLVLVNAASFLLWRGGEISQNSSKNKPVS